MVVTTLHGGSPLLVHQGEDSEWPRGGCNHTNVPRGLASSPEKSREVIAAQRLVSSEVWHKLGRVPPRYVKGADQSLHFPEPSRHDYDFFAECSPRAVMLCFIRGDTLTPASTQLRAVLANSV